MVRAAVGSAGDVKVIAVTILTSLGSDDLEQIGVRGQPEEAVLRLAEVALCAGAPGLVCSPLEVAAIRSEFGKRKDGGPLLVVPGIRAAGSEADDQRRTMTPRQALDAGADILVVGRPITAAPDPRRAAEELAAEVR
jgi:orotidine-5'-phosphate decarboxylase